MTITMKHNINIAQMRDCINGLFNVTITPVHKDEIEYKHCKTFGELRLVIEEYVAYYNQEREQWERKKMTPMEYRNHLLAQV